MLDADALRRPARAALYASWYASLRDVAREHGYALALHGSLHRDCDLVAVPWTDDVTEPDALIEALRECVDGYYDPEVSSHLPECKPHGRLAWVIHVGYDGAYLDVSVIPPAVSIPSTP